jgi:hypothetical protein
MPVPEAAIYENSLALGSENQIWGSWQLASAKPDLRMVLAHGLQQAIGQRTMEPIPVSSGMQQTAQD